jgi:uncharacterized membrane protein YhaH (DUF805 family)
MLLIVLYFIVGIAMIVPTLAVTARRLHDIGKSAWTYLIAIVPIIGLIVLLVFFCRDSEPGTNQWGRNPKEPDSDEYKDHLV